MKASPHLSFASQISEPQGNCHKRIGLGSIAWALALAALAGLTACGPAGTDAGTGGALASGGQVGAGGGATTGGGSSSSGGESAASGGAASGGAASGGAGTTELPPDSTQANIAAFLAADSYKTWRHDAAPRVPIDATNPHLNTDAGVKLQVYFNSTAAASIAENMGKPLLDTNHTVGSMVVKEMYDGAGVRVGRGTSIKTGPDRRAFTFYCEGTLEACGVKMEAPIYGGNTSPCSGCHGGSIFAPVPAP
jgi:hypothetical protein